MIWIVRVFEDYPLELSRRRIPGYYVEVYVAILILEEDIIEMVWPQGRF